MSEARSGREAGAGSAAPAEPGRVKPGRARARSVLLGLIGLLYLLSVPWYRAPGASPAVWLGLPSWVTVALGCYVACAFLNALAWSWTEIPDAPVRDAEGELGGARE